jgi:hypothetical protein
MTPSAGDLLTVEVNRDTGSSTGHSRTRMVTLECTGAGGWIGSSFAWKT